MKRILFIIVSLTISLGLSVNGLYAQDQSESGSQPQEELNSNPSKEEQAAPTNEEATPKDATVEDGQEKDERFENSDVPTGSIYCSSVEGSEELIVDGKRYTLVKLEKEWYETQWLHIALLVAIAIVLLFVVIIFLTVKSCTDRKEVEEIIREYKSRHPHYNNAGLENSNLDIVVTQIRNLDNRLTDLEKDKEYQKYQPKQESKPTQLSGIAHSVERPAAPVIERSNDVSKKDKKNQGKYQTKTQPSPKRFKYATQDASNPSVLMGVRDTLDPYDHTFVITMDPGSETEGSFQMREEKAEECLNNNDSMLCCIKNGNGGRITRQVPGRVTINGDMATVTSQVQIFVE